MSHQPGYHHNEVDDRIVAVLHDLIRSEHSLGVIVLELGTTNRIGEVLGSIRGSGGQPKHIKEGYQYVGVAAAQMWKAATADDNYPTLSWGIKSLNERWNKIKKKLTEPRHYVSIGAGTGEKDRTILNHLHHLNRANREKLIYVPVDISTDLLKAAVQESTMDIDKDHIRVIPIQLDITRDDALRELRAILDALFDGTGAIVSLLGNTLANFRDDDSTLDRLSRSLLSPDDVLLLELATTSGVTSSIIRSAEAEYDNSRTFRQFAMATLGDLTDCTLKNGKVVCEGVASDHHLKLVAKYRPTKSLKVTFRDGEFFSLGAKDAIELYMSRKYTDDGLATLLNDFTELDTEASRFSERDHFGIVTKLLCLTEGTDQDDESHPVA